MNLLNQTLYAAKRIMVDKKAVVSKLLMIIIIILILGSALGDAFGGTNIERTSVAYFINDKGEAGKEILENMKNEESITEWIDFVEVSSLKEGENLIMNEDVTAAIGIPEDFSDNLADGQKEKSVIQIYRSKFSGVESTVVQNVIDSYINGANAATVYYDIKGNLEGFEINPDTAVKDMPLANTDTASSAMDYYAVAMFVMILMYGAIYGCDGIGEDFFGTLGERIKCTPIKPFEQYFGKIIGLSLATFIQGIIVILFTKFAYNVSWGNNPFTIILATFSISVASTTIGAAICLLVGKVSRADSIVSVFIILSTFLAGGFVKVDLATAKFFAPSYYAQTAVFGLVYSDDKSLAYRYILILWIIALAASIIAVVASRRKRA